MGAHIRTERDRLGFFSLNSRRVSRKRAEKRVEKIASKTKQRNVGPLRSTPEPENQPAVRPQDRRGIEQAAASQDLHGVEGSRAKEGRGGDTSSEKRKRGDHASRMGSEGIMRRENRKELPPALARSLAASASRLICKHHHGEAKKE